MVTVTQRLRTGSSPVGDSGEHEEVSHLELSRNAAERRGQLRV